MGLLRRQCDLHRGLQRMAARQRRLVHEDDPGSLLSLLNDRRALTESLLEVGRQLAPVRENWPAVRESLAPADRAEADDIIAEIDRLLAQVIDSDEEDARLLSTRKAQVAGEMTSLRADRQAAAAYAATSRAAGSGGARLDRMSEET
jgi:hypothetical protein